MRPYGPSLPVKIISMAQSKLKQGLQGLEPIMQDSFTERMVMPTASPFNSPLWSVVKPQKNK